VVATFADEILGERRSAWGKVRAVA
jgi:hypothetical protein